MVAGMITADAPARNRSPTDLRRPQQFAAAANLDPADNAAAGLPLRRIRSGDSETKQPAAAACAVGRDDYLVIRRRRSASSAPADSTPSAPGSGMNDTLMLSTATSKKLST